MKKFKKSKLRKFSKFNKFIDNSNYSKQLFDKQKLKFLFCLREKQFKKTILKYGFLGLLSRFDNILLKLSFVKSILHSRQLINHKFFKINGLLCNKPSKILKINDKLSFNKIIPNFVYNKNYFIYKENGYIIKKIPKLSENFNLSFYSR
ncbi:S4 domain-containing protein [Candidatus Vidania fulgoroideorum]